MTCQGAASLRDKLDSLVHSYQTHDPLENDFMLDYLKVSHSCKKKPTNQFDKKNTISVRRIPSRRENGLVFEWAQADEACESFVRSAKQTQFLKNSKTDNLSNLIRVINSEAILSVSIRN